MLILSQNKKVKLKFNDTNFNMNNFVEMYGNRYIKYTIEGAGYENSRIHKLGKYKTKKRATEIYKEILKLINTKNEDYLYIMPEE